MEVPLVGPSYQLDSRPASVQRTINLVPVPQEPGNERTGWTLKDVPGLRPFPENPAAVDPLFGSVLLLATFDVDGTDYSVHNNPFTQSGSPPVTFSGGVANIPAGGAFVEWAGNPVLTRNTSLPLTIEMWTNYVSLFPSQRDAFFSIAAGSAINNLNFSWLQSGSNELAQLFQAPNSWAVSTDTAPDVWIHVAVVLPSGSNPTVSLYFNGAAAGTASIQWNNGTANSMTVRIGESSLGVMRVDDLRITRAARYTGPFTPPPRGSLR